MNSKTAPAVISREALAADRWALFAELRAHNPVHWSGELNSWFIVRHADVRSALQSPQLVAAHPLRSSRQIFGRTALDTDGTAHRDLRRMVAWFSPAENAGYHHLIDRVIERVVADVDPAEEIDLVRSVAERIPARVIAAILGMPDDDGERFYHQLRPVFAHIDDPRRSLMAALDAYDGAAEMVASTVFSDDGLVAALARGHHQRTVPSPPEVRRQILLLLAARHPDHDRGDRQHARHGRCRPGFLRAPGGRPVAGPRCRGVSSLAASPALHAPLYHLGLPGRRAHPAGRCPSPARPGGGQPRRAGLRPGGPMASGARL